MLELLTKLNPAAFGARLAVEIDVPDDVARLAGAAAAQAFERHVAPALPAGHGLTVLALPSTSPANAAWSLPRLRQAWQARKPDYDLRRDDLHDDSAHLLAGAIATQPPLKLSDGGVIAEGFDAELDELRRLSTHADQFLVDLEQRERESSGIATLKVGYNRVHGYYIEISKGQSDRAPVHYTRRQTLTNAERYITEELKAFEDKVLSARDRALSREKLLYEQLLDTLGGQLEPLKQCAAALSELDVLAGFIVTIVASRRDMDSRS